MVTGDESGITVSYGQCLNGAWGIGTLVGILAPGQICVMPADGFSDVMVADCDFVETTAFGASAMVGGYCEGYSCEPVAVESSTWGQVKALYR